MQVLGASFFVAFLILIVYGVFYEESTIVFIGSVLIVGAVVVAFIVFVFGVLG